VHAVHGKNYVPVGRKEMKGWTFGFLSLGTFCSIIMNPLDVAF
jgi:hypothetical protein